MSTSPEVSDPAQDEDLPLLEEPADGVPELIDTVAGFRDAARNLDAGYGPFAIDTERASGFRFDDRAFLVQVRRRGAGTFLLAPEGHRIEFTAALAPVLNGAEWVIHAAHSDLPCLAWLDLRPGSLFDTELAGRIAGFPRVNLATMTASVLGVRLEKGHGTEDWSVTPLPESWLTYAALDVELLLELAEALAEILDAQGKLEWADEEFAAIVEQHRDDAPPERTWRNIKGLSKVVSTRTLGIARELWKARERYALKHDVCPTVVLSDKMILAIAQAAPRHPQDLHRIPGMRDRYRRRSSLWLSAVRRGRSIPGPDLPGKDPKVRKLPSPSSWPRRNPEGAELLEQAQAAYNDYAEQVNLSVENLIKPAILRATVWHATHWRDESIFDVDDLVRYLEESGVRTWQREIAVSILAPILFSEATS